MTASAKLGLAAIPFFVGLRLLHGEAWQGGVVLGFGAGLVVGLLEFFLIRQRRGRLRFVPYVGAKAIVLLAAMFGAFAVLNLLDVALDGISWAEYGQALTSPSSLRGLVEAFLVLVGLLFVVELDRLLGPGVLKGLLVGRYHRPRREERVFMFLDLKGSTAIAERMEADRYFAFLQESFAAMSEAILESNAEIYQYVGDEVVLTWRTREGFEEANCVKVFFRIQSQLERRRQEFESRHGAFPEFKAGVHAGEVVAAHVGDLKQEMAFSGDVLSTTARIQSLCNALGHRLLASRAVVSRMHLGAGFEIESMGRKRLKGRTEAEMIFGIRLRQSPS